MLSYRSLTTTAAVACAATLALAPAAGAVNYPPPSKPSGATGKPKGPFHTLKVCKHGKSCFPRIADAVRKAKPGDTIKVAHGTYKEAVSIVGAKKRYIKLVGDPKAPDKVKLEGSNKKANGVLINGADHVTVNGFSAKHYKANGFFVTNATGYKFTNLRASLVGVYGLYAFNSIGGEMSNSIASWNSDSGFYVGQTPPQTKPVRTILKNLQAFGNVLGYSGTNSRYVTITDSKFYNNGAGIVPNTLDSEKYAPNESNVITRNEVFWNNYNYYAGSPFKRGKTSTGDVPFPIGVGILLFGGRNNEITGNKVYGNWLVGIGALQAITLQQADAKDLIGNKVMGNDMGMGGADPNGRDLFYDGNGSGNCFQDNGAAPKLFPADGSTFVDCSNPGPNTFNAAAQGEAVNWTVSDPTHEAYFVKGPHISIPGITPLEHYTAGTVK